MSVSGQANTAGAAVLFSAAKLDIAAVLCYNTFILNHNRKDVIMKKVLKFFGILLLRVTLERLLQ